EAAAKGQFREELYYRVNVIAILLPPLRDREGDVRLLAQAFLKRYGGGRVRGIDDEAMAALERYRWPGNVRELQNIIGRPCARAAAATIGGGGLPDQFLTPSAAPGDSAVVSGVVAMPESGTELPLKDAKERWMAVLEASSLRELLARHDGNISAAAKAAGIDRKTFHRLINKHQLR